MKSSQTTETDQSPKTSRSRRSSQRRTNYSKCGKLCDQTLYIDNSQTKFRQTGEVEVTVRGSPRNSTTGFTSISRQKQQNFRFDVKHCKGEFMYHPEHMYGHHRSPSWSFPKRQRYSNSKYIEYEICHKNPMVRNRYDPSQARIFHSVTPANPLSTTGSLIPVNPLAIIKPPFTKTKTQKHKQKLSKSNSFKETMNQTHNYSILQPRRTSMVDFFSHTKLTHPVHLTKNQVMTAEEQLSKCTNERASPSGYVQFYKRRPRANNCVTKNFEIVIPNYQHEQQFNNFSMTEHPTKPSYHIDFDKLLPRTDRTTTTYGPGLQYTNLDPARKNDTKINLNTKDFIETIRTRYDRADPQPSPHLDSTHSNQKSKGMITMNKMLGRNPQLFPTINPNIKKAGDSQIRQTLQKCIQTHQYAAH